MLEALFGNTTTEKVLFYLLRYGHGYAKAMATKLGVPLYSIQRQLARLESGRIVASRKYGRTRLYEFDPRYPFRNELAELLRKAFSCLPEETVRNLYSDRTRPPRAGKS